MEKLEWGSYPTVAKLLSILISIEYMNVTDTARQLIYSIVRQKRQRDLDTI